MERQVFLEVAHCSPAISARIEMGRERHKELSHGTHIFRSTIMVAAMLNGFTAQENRQAVVGSI